MANQYTAYTYITDTLKQCSWCKEIKPHSSFHKDNKNKRNYKLAYYCKECANLKARLHHKKRTNDNDLSYKEQKRSNYYKTKYGISLQEHNEKLAQQNNCCAICEVKLLAHGFHTHLDHDHKTGKLRAFLCTNCNRGLGHFQDSTDILEKAIKYLNAHRNNDVVSEKELTNDCTH